MKGLSIVLAAAGGAIVGAAAALLLAPKSGPETRETIRRFVKDHCPDIKKHRLEKIADEIEAELAETK